MSPKPDVSAERKSQIVKAAMRLFARRGFKEATMDEIVAESGLSKGALYWYFKSKDEIIGAILDYSFKRELADLRALPDAPGSARARLQRALELTLAEAREMKPLLPIFYEFFALAFRNKSVRKALQQYLREYLTILTPLVQQGVDRGEFRPVPVEQVALAIGAMIEGSALLWALDPKSFPLETQMQAGVQAILDGLEIRESSRSD